MSNKQVTPPAEVFKAVRRYYNLTLAEMSAKLGISKGCISSIEQGLYGVSFGTLRKYAEFMEEVPSTLL